MIACVCFLFGAGNGLLTAWQDFRSREIHILPLGLMALSGILFRSFKHQWFWIHAFMINMMMLIAMIGIIYGFYRLKGEKKIMDVKMGWGDVIFLIILGIWFDPEWFILFYSRTKKKGNRNSQSIWCFGWQFSHDVIQGILLVGGYWLCHSCADCLLCDGFVVG